MQRRRSVPHIFEDNIAIEKAKLEAQLAQLKPGPELDAVRRKIRQLDTAAHRRLAFVARLATTKTAKWSRQPELAEPELPARLQVYSPGQAVGGVNCHVESAESYACRVISGGAPPQIC
jgi:hypothetical protein